MKCISDLVTECARMSCPQPKHTCTRDAVACPHRLGCLPDC